MVEHIDGGTVGEILVRDGDQSDAGDVLIRLDDTLLRSEEAILQAGHAELVARRNRLEAQARATERQRGFIGQELDAQRSLSERGLTDLPELLRLERAAAGLDGQAGDIEARIAEARGRIEEAEEQARENQVRAPVAGEVVGMQVFALREVVRPGEPILRLVPEGAGLVVLAAAESHLRGSGLCGAGGGAAVFGLPVAHHAALQGAHRAGVGGRRARRAYRAVMVGGGGRDGPRPGAGGRRRGVAGDRGGLAARSLSLDDGATECGGGCCPCERAGAVAGHAGEGTHPHRRSLAPQLPGQADHGLFFPVDARGLKGPRGRVRQRQSGRGNRLPRRRKWEGIHL